MARAINDISLVRQVIAGTTRMTAVLIFTAVVGLAFMFSLSTQLALAVIAPSPLLHWSPTTIQNKFTLSPIKFKRVSLSYLHLFRRT